MIRSGCTIVLAFILFAIGGCTSTIKVGENSPLSRRSYGVADYSAGSLCSSTLNLLGNFMLTELYETSPGQVLDRLENLFKKEKRPEIVAALADISLQTGYKFRENADLGSRWFLAAAVYSSCYLKYLDDIREPYDEQRLRLIRIHNLAVTELFFYLKARGLERRSGFEIPMPGGSERQVRFNAPVYELPVDEKDIACFTPCANFRTVGLTHDTKVFGLGVPLVAELKAGVRDVGGMMVAGLPVAVTVVGDFDIDLETMKISAVLRYIYSRVREKVTFGKKTLPLAADFSTPLASAVGKPQEMGLIERTVNVTGAARITGLYHLEPYDDKRIPVVFVHGLMSDARTWSQMLNTLLNDPVLRRQYQFLGFAYSSGNPVFISGAALRRELNALRERLIKEKRSTAAFDKMVLVGHSMGGLLSKLQITRCSGKMLLDTLKIKNESALEKNFSPEERGRFAELLNFEPAPFVKRVVFIAVPHKGSGIARSWIAKAGAAFIRLPAELVKRNVAVFKAFMGREKENEMPIRVGTGVDNLNPDDTMLKFLGKLKISENVPYHSIIGNRNAQGIPGGSDGVVPYSSSHLDGAVSELVVKSGHSVQQNSLAIQEIRRILLLHIDSESENEK